MNEFKYTADQIVNNSRFRCLEKLLILTKASLISIYSTTIWTKENFIRTSSSIKPNDNDEAKKYHAFITVGESINRSKEKLSNDSPNIKISKHKTRETN